MSPLLLCVTIRPSMGGGQTHNYPKPTSPATTAAMKSNRRVDTGPELRLRSLLHRAGLRFRKDFPVVASGRRVRPDIVLPRRKVAIFVDGCFWHGCPDHGSAPRSNQWYWGPKIRRNRERDSEVSAALEAEGWSVVRVWEHVAPEAAADQILSLVSPA